MKLIVTADDFGRSSQINAAVLQAHRRGILTSASLMVGGEAFDEAVELARQTPTLAVGLHVVLVEGKPVLPPEELAGLLDARGFFPDAPARLGTRYFFSPRARRQVAAELDAQFSRFAATGLPLSHVDGHQHLHVHPAVFPLILSRAARYRAKGIRLPYESELPWGPQPLAGLGRVVAMRLLSRLARRRSHCRPFATTDRVHGLAHSGGMSETYVVKLLERLNARSAEIYFHPTAGPRLHPLGPNPEELQSLVSSAVRRVIEARKIRLCTYGDLP